MDRYCRVSKDGYSGITGTMPYSDYGMKRNTFRSLFKEAYIAQPPIGVYPYYNAHFHEYMKQEGPFCSHPAYDEEVYLNSGGIHYVNGKGEQKLYKFDKLDQVFNGNESLGIDWHSVLRDSCVNREDYLKYTVSRALKKEGNFAEANEVDQDRTLTFHELIEMGREKDALDLYRFYRNKAQNEGKFIYINTPDMIAIARQMEDDEREKEIEINNSAAPFISALCSSDKIEEAINLYKSSYDKDIKYVYFSAMTIMFDYLVSEDRKDEAIDLIAHDKYSTNEYIQKFYSSSKEEDALKLYRLYKNYNKDKRYEDINFDTSVLMKYLASNNREDEIVELFALSSRDKNSYLRELCSSKKEEDAIKLFSRAYDKFVFTEENGKDKFLVDKSDIRYIDFDILLSMVDYLISKGRKEEVISLLQKARTSKFPKYVKSLGRIEDAINIYLNYQGKDADLKYVDDIHKYADNTYDFGRCSDDIRLVAYLCSLGREDEALERFPNREKEINEIRNMLAPEKTLTFNEDPTPESLLAIIEDIERGDFDGAITQILSCKGYPEDFKENGLSYIKDNNLFETWAKKYKEDEINKAKGKLDKFSDENSTFRDILSHTSLGLSEYLNEKSKKPQKNDLRMSADKKIAEYREYILWALDNIVDAYEYSIESDFNDHNTILKFFKTKEKDEKIKSKLTKKLLVPIKERKNIPNCVMITGNNPTEAKKLINWVKDNADANFVALPSRADCDEMRDELLKMLEEAKKGEEENKHTIIFVNGMEKLLNPNNNKSADIGVMKDFMGTACEDYNSTIIFYAKEPKKADPGTLATNRVKLKINLDEV